MLGNASRTCATVRVGLSVRLDQHGDAVGRVALVHHHS